MRLIILFIQIVLCSFVTAGEWTIVDSKTLSFSGFILEGELERFNSVYSTDIERIIVDSPGGYTLEALEIGMYIYRDGVDIEVDGECISSCALYFFLPAKNKILTNGLVGFHGSVGVTEETYPEDFYNPPDEELKLTSLPKEEAIKKLVVHVARERMLFEEIGVSKELFIRSNSFKGPKHMGCEEKTRIFFPSINTLEQYGVKGMIGPINPKLIKKINKSSSDYCFI